MTRLPLALRLSASTPTRETLPAVFVSAVYALVLYAAHRVGWLPDSTAWAAAKLSGSVSMVTGLLVAFRANSSIERWGSGRKAWASVQATSRSLLRILSVSLFPIPSENHEAFPSISGDEEKAKSDTDAQKKPNDKARKVDETIALIPAFCVALTYQLRGARLELGNLHADLRSLLPASYIASLERPAARANNVPPRSGTDASIRNDLGAPKLRRRTAAAPDAAKGSTRPQAPPAPDPERTAVAYKREEAREEAAQNIDPPAALRARATPRVGARGSVVPSNVPLDLLRVLQTRLNELHDTQTQTSERDVQPKLNGPCFAHCIGLLNTLTSTMTELEQIRDTPIPLALAIHLKQLLVLNVILVPLPLLSNLGPWAALVTAVVAYTYLGLDALAGRLAEPFGPDASQLPLDRFAAEITREWREIAARTVADETRVQTEGEWDDDDGASTQSHDGE